MREPDLRTGRGTWSPLGLFFIGPQFCHDGQVFQSRSVLSRFTAGGDVSQQTSHDLSAASFGQCRRKADLIRCCQCPDCVSDVVDQFLLQLVVAFAALEGHEAADTFAFDLMRKTDNGGFCNFWMRNKSSFRLPSCSGDVRRH